MGMIAAYEEEQAELDEPDLVRSAAQMAASHAQALVALRLLAGEKSGLDQAARVHRPLPPTPEDDRTQAPGSASWRPNPQLRKLAIVPAFNESGMVARVIRDIRRAAPDFDIVVIDDGSTDTTAAHAEAQGAVVIRHPFNLGIGGAMQSGYKYALRHGYDVAVQVDGDGQHKPEYLPELLDALQTEGDEADMVTGSRFLGEPGYKVPLGRRAGNLIFARRHEHDHRAARSPTPPPAFA